MFDLETAIAEWKQSLATRESLSAENVAELETHLRETVTSLISIELTKEEAFLIGLRRVGSSVDLGTEFMKENRRVVWERRLKWILVGQLLFWAISKITLPMVMTLQVFTTHLEAGSSAWTFSLLHAAFDVATLIAFYYFTTRIPAALDRMENRAVAFNLRRILVWALCLLFVPQIPLFFVISRTPHVSMPPIWAFLLQSVIALAVPALTAMYVTLLHRREQREELA